MRFLISSLILVLCFAIQPALSLGFPVSIPINKYKSSIDSVKEAILMLPSDIPSADLIRVQLRGTLVNLYLAEHKEATAKWIETLSDEDLRNELKRQKEQQASDFVPAQPILFQLASIDEDGRIRVRGSACPSVNCHFSPDSSNYVLVKKLVGSLEPGHLKEINPLPDSVWKSAISRTSTSKAE